VSAIAGSWTAHREVCGNELSTTARRLAHSLAHRGRHSDVVERPEAGLALAAVSALDEARCLASSPGGRYLVATGGSGVAAGPTSAPQSIRHRYITLQVMDRIKRLRTVGVLGVEAASTVLAQVASLSGHSSPSSMWDYIDWAYQEMAVSAEGRGDSELQSLINELEVLRGCAEQRSGDSQLLLRVQAALKSLLGSAPKLGVLAHQAGRSGRTG
jgi:hypothetical protein